jgi:hypothetical protein
MAKINFITLAKPGEPKTFSRILSNEQTLELTLRKPNDTDMDYTSTKADDLSARYITGGWRRLDGVWSEVPDILPQQNGVVITPSRLLFFKCVLLELIQCQAEKYTWDELTLLAAVDGDTFAWLNECMNSFYVDSGELQAL